MEHLLEILHELISHAHGQGLSGNRAAELHALADKVGAVAGDVEEVAQDAAAVTDGTPAAK